MSYVNPGARGEGIPPPAERDGDGQPADFNDYLAARQRGAEAFIAEMLARGDHSVEGLARHLASAQSAAKDMLPLVVTNLSRPEQRAPSRWARFKRAARVVIKGSTSS